MHPSSRRKVFSGSRSKSRRWITCISTDSAFAAAAVRDRVKLRHVQRARLDQPPEAVEAAGELVALDRHGAATAHSGKTLDILRRNGRLEKAHVVAFHRAREAQGITIGVGVERIHHQGDIGPHRFTHGGNASDILSQRRRRP
nr:hypothetical protein [Roseomonas sp. AR75]